MEELPFVNAILMKGFNTHNEVWSNNEYRKSAVDTLISIGTNQFLLRKEEVDTKRLLMVAQSIRVLENYNGVLGVLNSS